MASKYLVQFAIQIHGHQQVLDSLPIQPQQDLQHPGHLAQIVAEVGSSLVNKWCDLLGVPEGSQVQANVVVLGWTKFDEPILLHLPH